MKRLLLLIVLVVASSAVTAAPKAGEAGNLPHGSKLDVLPLGHARAIPADTQLVNSGRVLEVLDTDMYTYVQVTTEKGPLWIAAYKTAVSKGATVRYSNGVAMSNFRSNALNRMFDVIVFVDALEQAGK